MSPQKVSHKLKEVVRRELGEELDKEQQRADWSEELTDEMLTYAAKDAEVLPPLKEKLAAKVEDADLKRVMEIEHRALPAIVWMANAGVPFDAEGWLRHLEQVGEEKNRLGLELKRLAPEHPEGKEWNWNSWQQVLKAFGLLGVDLPNTKEETLSRCGHPLAHTLLEYRKTSKVLGTYGPSLLEKVEEDSRIYASWWQIGAGTGRMACSNPNLQNLPPEARKLAKAVNFGLLYGMGPAGLRHYARGSYGVEMTSAEAERYWRGFFRTYPGLKAWHDREYRELKKGSTETRTLTGRRRTGVTKLPERLNSPVQGTGADGIKVALAYLWEHRDECPEAVPILAVHDEIVVECDQDQAEEVEAWLRKAMINGMDEVVNSGLDTDHPDRVPIDVDVEILKSWGDD